MKGIIRITSLLLCMQALLCCQPEPAPKPEPEKPEPEKPEDKVPAGKGYIALSTDKVKLVDCGQTKTVWVETNLDDWTYALSSEGIAEVSRDAGSVVFGLDDTMVTDGDKTVTVTFSSPSHPEASDKMDITVKCALTLDVAFKADGTAGNVSSWNFPVTTVSGVSMACFDGSERGTARFFHPAGFAAEDSYVRVDYSSSGSRLKDALTDGFAIETAFVPCGVPADSEVGIFSSTRGGGTGIILDRGEIVFVVSTGKNSAAGTVRKVGSGVFPQPGQFCHAVGVWDKASGTASLYIDGKLAGTAPADGVLCLPASVSRQWFCIGGDVEDETAMHAFSGDITLARIYDSVPDENRVRTLHSAVQAPASVCPDLGTLLYIPHPVVAVGSRYPVWAEKMESGDQIALVDIASGQAYDCATSVTSGRADVILPAGISGGAYRILHKRGAQESVIGKVDLEIAKGVALGAARIVAHRGVHSASVPENSIESLRLAQEMGVYGSEMDCWITTDGKVFVNHDGVISGKRIQDCTSSDLSGVKLSNGESLPTFSEYLAQAAKNRNTKLIIEIKEHSSAKRNADCVDRVMQIVSDAGMDSDVEWISFDREVCRRILEARPGAVVGYLNSDATASDLASEGFRCMDYSFSFLFNRPDYISAAHEAGILVNIWTVNTRADLLRSLGLGVDYITTDKPELLADIKNKLFD